jgi:hypothetical protein
VGAGSGAKSGVGFGEYFGGEGGTLTMGGFPGSDGGAGEPPAQTCLVQSTGRASTGAHCSGVFCAGRNVPRQLPASSRRTSSDDMHAAGSELK